MPATWVIIGVLALLAIAAIMVLKKLFKMALIVGLVAVGVWLGLTIYERVGG